MPTATPNPQIPADGSNASWTESPRAWLLLLAVGVLLYLPFLGVRDLWYPDEPDIAEVTKAMFESGDWITPRKMGVAWVDYPPMIFWTAAASGHLFGGLSEFAIRLPNALSALALVLATYFAGARWFGSRAGLWAGFLLLTFPEYVRQAVGYRPDVLFSLFIGAGLFTYARGVEGDRARWGPRVLAFVLLGLAMLSKGPLGLLLPGLVLTLWHVTRGQWRRFLELAPLSIVALAVYLSWFVACAKAMGTDSILAELYMQNLQRFLSDHRGHGRPIYYYLVRTWGDLAPWSLLTPVVVVWVFRARRWQERHVQLLLWWFLAFFVFLSIGVTKRGVYLLPAYPAAALLIGYWLAAVCRQESWGPAPAPRPARVFTTTCAVLYPLLGLVCLAIAIGAGSIAARLELDEVEMEVARAVPIPLAALGLVLIAAGAWVAVALRGGKLRTALFRLAAAHVPFYLVFLGWAWPTFNPVKTYAPQARWVREQIGTEERIGIVNPKQGMARRKRGALAFYSGAMVDMLSTRAEIERFLQEHPGSVVLVEEETLDVLYAGEEDALHDRVVRTLKTATQRYVVVRASSRPAPGA